MYNKYLKYLNGLTILGEANESYLIFRKTVQVDNVLYFLLLFA